MDSNKEFTSDQWYNISSSSIDQNFAQLHSSWQGVTAVSSDYLNLGTRSVPDPTRFNLGYGNAPNESLQFSSFQNEALIQGLPTLAGLPRQSQNCNTNATYSNPSSSRNVMREEENVIQLMQQPPKKKAKSTRSYTKVLKLGSIGRSVDVTRFRNYSELKSELARMFNLEGQLDQNSGWQLVYMDNEGDILLVGDDRWEEFVSSVRGIRIMSPSEVAIYAHSEEYAGTPLSSCLNMKR